MSDSALRAQWRRAPCSRAGHHAYLGGLLEHTVAVGTLALEACQLHPRLNSDLLITAALVHDLGKTREFTYGAEIGLSDEGRLLGHVVLGQRLLDGYELPDDRRLALMHCVLGHHGRGRLPGRRFGSAEALALYRLNALDASVKGALEHGLAVSRRATDKLRVMKLLVLGGTVFLGRHVVNAALERGHEVTIYSRGLHGEPNPGAEHVIGDRADVTPLKGRAWDAAIDTSGFEPEQVEASASLDVGHYVFVSSCNAYPDWPEQPVDEDSPTWQDGEGYGQGKAASERVAHAAMGGRFATVRAGLIVGTLRQHLPPAVVGAPDRRGRDGAGTGEPRPGAADHRRAGPRALLPRPRRAAHRRRVQRHGPDRADDVGRAPRRGRGRRARVDPRRAARRSRGRAVDGAPDVAAGRRLSGDVAHRHRQGAGRPGSPPDRSPKPSRTSAHGWKTGARKRSATTAPSTARRR